MLQNTQNRKYSLFVQLAWYYTSINIFKHQFPSISLVDKWPFICHVTAQKFEELLNICWTVPWNSYWIGFSFNSTEQIVNLLWFYRSLRPQKIIIFNGLLLFTCLYNIIRLISVDLTCIWKYLHFIYWFVQTFLGHFLHFPRDWRLLFWRFLYKHWRKIDLLFKKSYCHLRSSRVRSKNLCYFFFLLLLILFCLYNLTQLNSTLHEVNQRGLSSRFFKDIQWCQQSQHNISNSATQRLTVRLYLRHFSLVFLKEQCFCHLAAKRCNISLL